MQSHRWKLALIFATLLGMAWLAWDPFPSTGQSFDLRSNGLWIGHKWYTGRRVDNGAEVGEGEVDAIVRQAEEFGIRFLYMHAGPVRADGSVRDSQGSVGRSLLTKAQGKNIIVLPWLGSIVDSGTFMDPSWTDGFIRTVEGLRDEGYTGVHLDFEPLRDWHPGYIGLLETLRQSLGGNFVLSHATRRAGPFGVSLGVMDSWFWSSSFYRSTMAVADQTVLMAYDTRLPSKKLYAAFASHETRTLLQLSGNTPDHRLQIGIPSYEDAPQTSDPRVENIPMAARGVRAGLEALDPAARAQFEGVAIYSNWVTDAREWEDFRGEWINP